MNRFHQALAVTSWLTVAAAAQAQFSSTIAGTTDYDFRGVTQSAKDPALQASLDYAFPSGFAVGAWASNVDFGSDVDADIEVDYYASYSKEVSEALSWSLGGTFYTYPGSDDVEDYPEVYLGVDAGKFSFKQWYADNYLKADAGSAWYSDAAATFELQHGLSLLLHAGYSWGDYWHDAAGGEVMDYSVGLGYTAGKFDLNLKWTGTDASGAQKVTTDANNNQGRVVFTVSTTLPWGQDE